MLEIFLPQECAILLDYFGIERPAELQNLNIYSPNGESDDSSQPVLVEPDFFGSLTSLSIPNAVARLLLSRIQDRLPQWVLVKDSGEIVFARKKRQSKMRKILVLPQFLFEMNWADSGPGYSWPEAYHVTYVPGFQRYVVTASADSPDAQGYTDFAIGWFPQGADVVAGAKPVIQARWNECRGDEGWEYVLQGGLVSEDEAIEWRAEVWPGPPVKEDDEEEITEATGTRSGSGPRVVYQGPPPKDHPIFKAGPQIFKPASIPSVGHPSEIPKWPWPKSEVAPGDATPDPLPASKER